MTRIFLDTEFSGLHQETTLISIGLVTDGNATFYAELTDYDQSQIDDWLQENVIDNLLFKNEGTFRERQRGIIDYLHCKGNTKYVKNELHNWLSFYKEVEIWSDTLAYDWVLFNQLFGHAFNIPKNVSYIPIDLSTMLRLNGYDPDISRESLANVEGDKHNALYDAKVIRDCVYYIEDELL